jgi:hypothetical protein
MNFDENWDKKFDKNFDRAVKGFGAIWIALTLGSLATTAVIVWAIIKIVNHFT